MPKGKKAVAKSTPLDRARLFQTLVANPGLKTSELDKLVEAEQVDIREALQEWELAGATHRTGRTRGTRWFVNAGATMPETLPPEAGERKPKSKAAKNKAAKNKAAKSKKKAAPEKKVAKAPTVTKAKKTPPVAKASKPGKAARGRPKGGKGRAPQAAVLDKHRSLLGTVPDDVAAERTGVPARTIQYYRKKNGIAGYAGPKRRGKDAVGTRPAQAAKAAPVSKGAKSGGKAVANGGPVAKAAPAKRAAGGRSAWRVELRTGRDVVNRYTFANSLTDAAALAARTAASLGAEVVGLAWVGDALE